MRWTLLAALVLIPCALVSPARAAEDPGTKVCTFDAKALPEVSGMTSSIRHKNVLWVHNDSGDDPTIYAINATTCEILARVTLADVPARDLEAIASGRDAKGNPVIWIADIGDNKESWEWVRLYQLPEPKKLVDQTLQVRGWRFTYPDGPHDAETLLVNPKKEQAWVITKSLAAGVLYKFPKLPPLALGEVWKEALVLSPVGDTEGLISDGAVSPDGSRYVTRDYLTATVYDGLPPGTAITTVDLPTQPQGEAITWGRDGRTLLVAGEREGTLWSVPLPKEAWTATALAADAALTSDNPGVDGDAPAGESGVPMTALIVLTVVGLIIAVGVIGMRRSRGGRRYRY